VWSVLWGADAVYQTCRIALHSGVSATPAKLKDCLRTHLRSCFTLFRMRARQIRTQLHQKKTVKEDELLSMTPLTDEAWKEEVLCMLRALLQKSASTASPSPPSDAGSPSRLSSLADGTTPRRTSSSRTGSISDASSRASATPDTSPSLDLNLEGFLHNLAQMICDVKSSRTITPDRLASQLKNALQNLGPQALAAVQEQMRGINRTVNMFQHATAASEALECARVGTAS